MYWAMDGFLRRGGTGPDLRGDETPRRSLWGEMEAGSE